ncbi:3'(2'),5'-bisphosphate nucleotidase CysQ [Chelatococcus sambhunathii]|uniref:3'(2'),5'-bisphosphate nucleotidase CysQ n=1 Tax=Chelatococcus sambhunathii TaxID=363953 RepID=UPI0028525AE9|nr:3'(2'),5'-bisphosphate nucleotidase CysQ [Chelatococcus sambhunathii]
MPSSDATIDLDRLAVRLDEIVREAGDIALRFFRDGAAERWTKGDDSPVTEADIAVDRFLAAELPPLVAGSGWLSEETADTPDRLACRRLWIVDPIDGTRAFVENKPEWVVSVALVEDGAPVAGVVRNPCEDASYAAIRGGGATLTTASGAVALEVPDAEGLGGLSISGPSSLVGPLKASGVETGKWHYALANRLVQVAGGKLDAALARPRAHDWDIAAAHLILEEAGARLIGFDGQVPFYNRETTRHGGLIAAAPRRAAALAAAVEEALAATAAAAT